MTLEFQEDLTVFFAAGEFAEPVVVDGVSLLGVFTEGYAESLDIEGTNPTLECISAELPGDLETGAAVVRAGKTYVVATIKPDGTGVTVLELEYQSG